MISRRVVDAGRDGGVLKSLLLASLPLLLAGCQDPPSTPALVDLVNPLIGTDSEYAFSHGNTYPAVALPFGMTSWTPQTGKRFSAWIYQHDVNSIVGFRATHQASVWRGDYGQFSLMPMSGELSPDVEDRRTTFSREREAASPPSTGRTSTSTTSTWRCPRP
ncbi:MAG: hypothetical protein QGI32_00670 [Candidatus Latescibacteria bacterium]|jgi:putative alpha-1,2-mannosidase|nr:hypothetical protein [Candidatus Latescibacterota bacterium]